jgi:LAO/AO transport system kinase
VVEAPGMGDEVQAIKAGILEIADVLVVNKADRQGVNHTVQALKMMLELGHPASRSQQAAHHGRLIAVQNMPNTPDNHDEALWIPPITQTVATEAKGITEVVEAIAAHRRYMESGDLHEMVKRQHIEIELYERLRDSLMARLLQDVPTGTISSAIEQIQAREIDPQSAVRQILAQV